MKKIVAFLAAVSAFPAVYAASILPSDFETQIGDAKTDMTTIIGAVMGLVILLLAWRYVRRSAS